MSTERTGLDDVVALSVFQLTIGEWARDTFPNHTAAGIAAHLNEEAHEVLNCAIGLSTKPIAEELADCFILLATLADHLGVSIAEAARDKHAINVRRRWARGSGGYHKHVEEVAR